MALLRCLEKELPLQREICGVFCTSTPHCNLLQQSITRQHTAARCSTLPHTATYSNALQQIATSCNKLQHTCVPCAQCVCMLQLTHTLDHVESSSYHLHTYINTTALFWRHGTTCCCSTYDYLRPFQCMPIHTQDTYKIYTFICIYIHTTFRCSTSDYMQPFQCMHI